jgi:hypothetical protein
MTEFDGPIQRLMTEPLAVACSQGSITASAMPTARSEMFVGKYLAALSTGPLAGRSALACGQLMDTLGVLLRRSRIYL